MAEKEELYSERYPIDEDFLAALAGMPPASGIALGFDRLVMLATGAQRIDQVIWAPVGRDNKRQVNHDDVTNRRAALRARLCAVRAPAGD